MGRQELETVLDFILNRADEAEFEVIVKAAQRRQKDKRFMPAGSGGSPALAAKAMAQSMSQAMGANLEGIKDTVRDYVEDIIRKNAPGISEDELEVLMEHYVPSSGKDPSLGVPGDSGPIPPDALMTMVKQFVSFSSGAMPPSEQQYLWQEMPRWQETYWKAFPPDVKALVDGALKGKISMDQFWPGIKGLLGL